MPSVKIPKKSTENDMTPFVDVAFLILSFFMLATKFKPPDAVEIKIPNSVSSESLVTTDALLVSLDSSGRVFFTIQVEKDGTPVQKVIQNMNSTRNLNLTNEEMAQFIENPSIGVPIGQLKQYYSTPEPQRKQLETGIPIKDSASNELYIWVRDAVSAFAGKKIDYLIKGDNAAKYPHFKNVLEAFKRNDIYKFSLVTSLEDVPVGSEMYKKEGAKKGGGGAKK